MKDISFFFTLFSTLDSHKLFTKDLSKTLKFIEDNRYQGEHFYVYLQNGLNIKVKNENFIEPNWTDKNFKLISLFRYWNVIEYFFPYKYVMYQKWDTSLSESIPLFLSVNSKKEFQIAMQKLVVKLNDGHSKLWIKYPEHQGKYRRFLPFNGKIINDSLVITEILSDTLAKKDNFKIGDVITKINNKTIKQIIAEKREIVASSNESGYLINLLTSILTGFDDSIDLEIIQDTKKINRTVYWEDYDQSHSNESKIKKSELVKYKIIENNIGYVDMGKLFKDDVPDMTEKLKHTKAIIFDLRNYPHGTNYAISEFLNSREKEFAKYTKPDLSYPGKFMWTKPSLCGKENKNNYKGSVIILIDESSISQSEWTAMCFKTADNVTIIGSQTAGADGNVSNVDLIKEFDAPFSGIGVYYPDGRETQRIGIVPDIEVKPTIKGLQTGRDEILERAIKFINSEK